jgi:heavy metal sensor kinase
MMTIALLTVRARLTLWHAGALALIICLFAVGVCLFVRVNLYRSLDQQVREDLATIEKVYREETGDLGELALRTGTHFEVTEGPTVVYRTAGWPPTSATPFRQGALTDSAHRIIAARDETPVRQTLWTLAMIMAVAIPCAVGLAILGGYFLAGHVLAPVGTMADTARRITADSLDARLPVSNSADEFGRLANVFNETLTRLDAAFDQLRRFTADASHELRTPLAAIRSVGEVSLQRSLSAEGYRDVIGSMLEEVDRLTRLVENLLLLTRAEAGRIPLTRATVDLRELVAGVSDGLRVLAEEKNQDLTVELPGPVAVECDATVLRQGITNLLHNAIKFTPAKGIIRVAARSTVGGDAVIEVEDSGPGIPAADHQRVFERFYRVDQARSRDTGGTGLGLAIARWAVEASGGRIELESVAGRGTLFRVVLPRS